MKTIPILSILLLLGAISTVTIEPMLNVSNGNVLLNDSSCENSTECSIFISSHHVNISQQIITKEEIVLNTTENNEIPIDNNSIEINSNINSSYRSAEMLGNTKLSTVEMPTKMQYSNAVGITSEGSSFAKTSGYSVQTSNTSLQYYPMKINIANINLAFNKSNIASNLNITSVKVYPVISQTTYMKLVSNTTRQTTSIVANANGGVNVVVNQLPNVLIYRNYTVYNVGGESARIQTTAARTWIVELETEPMKSGNFNTTLGAITFGGS